jgi:hypothetical protein
LTEPTAGAPLAAGTAHVYGPAAKRVRKLIFERDNWYIRQLHSKAALTMLRRLHLRNMPVVILSMKL